MNEHFAEFEDIVQVIFKSLPAFKERCPSVVDLFCVLY